MPNPRIAKLIATGLREGLEHPGDPENNVPATKVALPLFRTAGMPKEMGDLVDGTVKLISEAIVHLIEKEDGGDSIIEDRAEAGMLRQVAEGKLPDGVHMVPLYCKCDTDTPLAVLTVNDPDRIVIDARPLFRSLAERNPACPHKRIEK